ncbi:hypothetical protein F2P44_31050 [Massilia sp. CCM 8695]|uniref:Integrase n=1 Tax=Massilia frigida TaxID=2609281 RepID=A0ABX0NDX8_9BURK|nr:hypothetical protein [Massilia frigida]NHZ83671.1 hypothetical protein [Massilia frigida]
MPGLGASRCRACTNENAVSLEVDLSQHVFEQEWTKQAWAEFGKWLHRRSPDRPRLLAVLRSHQPFFERLDAEFHSSSKLREDEILRILGSKMLRKHLLGMRFLEEHFGIVITGQTRTISADGDRIAAALAQGRHEPWYEQLLSYHKHLERANLIARTRRMYVSTAANFLRRSANDGQQWRPEELGRFLQSHRGARNNLGRFVSYCREQLGWNVAMPTDNAIEVLASPTQSAERLATLLAKVDDIGLETADTGLLIEILSTALGYSERRLLRLTAQDFSAPSKGAMVLSVGKERIVLPAGLMPVAARLRAVLK